jgi:hypothetical protein
MMTSEPTGNGELDERPSPARRSVDDLTGLLEISTDLAPRDVDGYASGLSGVRAPFHIRLHRDLCLWVRFSPTENAQLLRVFQLIMSARAIRRMVVRYQHLADYQTDSHGPGEPIL